MNHIPGVLEGGSKQSVTAKMKWVLAPIYGNYGYYDNHGNYGYLTAPSTVPLFKSTGQT